MHTKTPNQVLFLIGLPYIVVVFVAAFLIFSTLLILRLFGLGFVIIATPSLMLLEKFGTGYHRRKLINSLYSCGRLIQNDFYQTYETVAGSNL